LAAPPTARTQKPCLLPDRHPNRDFFVADMLDWAVKDDRASMEHPMFSLARNPDRRIRRYQHNGVSVTITPSVLGIATIWDKDCPDQCHQSAHRTGVFASFA
jgi:hypothetical protein